MKQPFFLESSIKMPRQSSSSPSKPTFAPPPKIWYSNQPSDSQPSLGQTVKQGFGMGVGMEAGRALVGSFFGSNRSIVVQQPQLVAQTNAEYNQCLEWNKTTPDICKPFLSKDPSSWKQCMEMNYFKASYCDQNH
jgi:hypothetical protein